MYVCVCNGVTDRDIRQAAQAGCGSMAELTMRTGCGACCGSCVEAAALELEQAQARPACGGTNVVPFPRVAHAA